MFVTEFLDLHISSISRNSFPTFSLQLFHCDQLLKRSTIFLANDAVPPLDATDTKVSIDTIVQWIGRQVSGLIPFINPIRERVVIHAREKRAVVTVRSQRERYVVVELRWNEGFPELV